MSSRIFSVSLTYLKILGSSPFDISNNLTHKRLIFCALLLAFFPFFMITRDYVTQPINFESTTNFVEQIGTIYQVIWKVYVIVTEKKKIAKAYESILNFICVKAEEKSELRRVIDDTHKQTFNLYRIHACCIGSAGFMFSLKPLLFFAKTLPAAFAFDCDLQNNLCFFPTWLFQATSVGFIISLVIAFDGLFFGLVSFAYIELEAIKYELTNLIEDDPLYQDEDYMKKIARIVKHHVQALEFIHLLDEIYRQFFFHQISTSMLGICLPIFELVLDGQFRIPLLMKCSTFFVGYYFQLFGTCIAGEFLTEQTVSVADTAYNCNWHIKKLPKTTMGLIMIIERAQRPAKLTIGNMYDLNLNLFTMVARSSFSLFTLMQTMYEEE